jgi:hypothetical protein
VITENKRFATGERVADTILGGGGVVCLLVLFYFFYRYAGTGEAYFTSPLGPVVYYVLPAVLATLLLAALRLRSRYKINLSLLLLSTAFSIYGVELFLNLSAAPLPWFEHRSQREKKEIAKEFGIDFDIRTRLEVIADLRKKGVEAYPYAAPPAVLKKQADGSVKSVITINGGEVLPLGGISNRVSVFCNENGAYTIYESDEHGFNNPKGLWKAGQVDIAALGDSFTQGACVPPDKNFVALIRKHYPATLNLGSSGQGPLLMLAALKEYGEYVRPKVVLWFYYEGNDLEDLKREKESPMLTRYIEKGFSQDLVHRQADIDRALAAHIETAREENKVVKKQQGILERINTLRKTLFESMWLGHLRGKLGLVYGEFSRPDLYEDRDASGHQEVLLNLFRAILLEAKTSVNAWGGKLYFVYLPDWSSYAQPKITSKDHERVIMLVKTIGLPVIDIHHAFQAHPDPFALFPFRQPAHYNEEGHRLTAEEVLRSVSSGE